MISFKKLPIKMQILSVGVLIIAIIPIIIGIIYQQASTTVINQSTRYNTDLVSILKQRVSSNNSDITNLMISMGYDATVQDFLTEQDSYKIYQLAKKVESLMKVAKNTKTDIIDIIITNNEGKTVSLNGNISYATKISEQMGIEDGNVHCIGLQKARIAADPEIDTFMFGMNILSGGNYAPLYSKIGFIAIILDVKAINSEIQKLPELAATNIYLIDNNNNTVITHNAPSKLILNENILNLFINNVEEPQIKKINKSNYIVQSHNLPEIKCKIVTATPIKSLIKDLGKIRTISFLLIIGTLIVVSIPFTTVMINILTPLKKLMNFMTSLESGNLKMLKSKVKLEGYAEIEVISNEFNKMLEQINSLTHRLVSTSTRLYQSDLEKQKAEMAYLQSQINPHFLYNTLDSIKGIALVKGVKEIYEMSSALSSIFRYSIKGSDEVTLGEELKIVESYIKILKIRFSDRITFEANYAENTLSVLIPKMVLQPIIENAFNHGLEPMVEGGVLKIKTQVNQSGNLEINIIDNGIGIETNTLTKIRKMLNTEELSSDKSNNENIGIKNVNNRLKLKYGADYGITINSSEGKGTEVLLTIPSNKYHSQY